MAVIGLGYIGLPTAAILATHGARVVGVDVDTLTIDAVNRGQVPFIEKDVDWHVSRAVEDGTLSATDETPKAGTYIIAVPTPFRADHSANLKFIDGASVSIARQLGGGELIILESTSPPGTTEHLADFILAQRPDLSLDGSEGRPVIHFAHCPKRVLPGRVTIELVTNDRIMGGLTAVASQMARDLYSIFCHGEILLTDAKTAELAKLVENSYRDVNIAFVNELSMISDHLDIDVWELIRLANHHPRVNILRPGPGVGGHCIAVDPWLIVAAAPEQSNLIRTAREVNDSKPEWVYNQVLDALSDLPESVEVGVFELTFKANIVDIRESPAAEIAVNIAERLPCRMVNIAEPHVATLPKQFDSLPNARLVSFKDALEDSGVVVILIDHDSVNAMNLVASSCRKIIDTRGIVARTEKLKAPESVKVAL